MHTKHSHITELFCHFASLRQKKLAKPNCETQILSEAFLTRLLSRYHEEKEVSILRKALLDPYFPLDALRRTIFADVVGMRFFINKRRPDLESLLTVELFESAAAFLSVRLDIQRLFNPETITCIPLDGVRHRLPSDQWCSLCGVCCQIGGVPSEPPQGIRYPEHWYAFLAGKTVENQQYCPFLFQYFGELRFFCAIHAIKPIACRKFDRENCRQRLSEYGLHEDTQCCSSS